MFKVSKLVDYAVIILTHLAEQEGVSTVPAISRHTDVPEPTVAKVLKILSLSSLVSSKRGIHGGYKIVSPLYHITVAQVVKAIEGNIDIAACVEGQPCKAHPNCQIYGGWDIVDKAIKKVMNTITLAEMSLYFIPRSKHDALGRERNLQNNDDACSFSCGGEASCEMYCDEKHCGPGVMKKPVMDVVGRQKD
ncbi:SUF system Fe-S cluster assembly regulator [Entomobacter blattae]|uniref:HTH-type transcriptional regulator IscR n=1 Tax=Entomobacter blattae TaxID=2762277 RepID=A0A7H1NSV1_9PROT|nr:SUF system Fe-S cluster assembly regulator [Entomobacter blattae]QNT78861.1 HTH-type transcriptional regulator IscR [Entomobacter blattae]